MPVNANSVIHGLHTPSTDYAEKDLNSVFAEIDRAIETTDWHYCHGVVFKGYDSDFSDRVRSYKLPDKYEAWMYAHIKSAYESKGWIVTLDFEGGRIRITVYSKDGRDAIERAMEAAKAAKEEESRFNKKLVAGFTVLLIIVASVVIFW